MQSCAFCLKEQGTIENAVTIVGGTACCKAHATRELTRLAAPPVAPVEVTPVTSATVRKAPPRAGDRLAKVR